LWEADDRVLRWMILSVTFAVWAGIMVLIYAEFSPKPDSDATPGTAIALRNMFSERAELKQSWNIFVDAERLNDNPDSPMAKLMASTGRGMDEELPKPRPATRNGHKVTWDGRGEEGFVRVGWVDSVMKKSQEIRIEQSVSMEMNFPPELRMPMLQLLGSISWQSRADITLERGLERFKSKITASVGFEITVLGVREGDVLALTVQVWEHGRQVLNDPRTMPVGRQAAPNVSMVPFQNNDEIRVGHSWEIPMLDPMSSLDGPPKLKVVRATCTGSAPIQYLGERQMALVVETEDGKAKAWYSGGGQVLKQVFSFAGALDVILVRVDPDREATPYRSRKLPRRERNGSAAHPESPEHP